MARKTGVQSQIESYQRLKKLYLMQPCLTIQHYKIIRIKGKVGQSRERSRALPYTSAKKLLDTENLYLAERLILNIVD